jgi:hypothetical protein
MRTAKNQYRKPETNNPFLGIAWPQSQYPHSGDCERIIYSHDRSACSVAGNMWTDLWNIQIHMNVEIGTELRNSRKRNTVHKWDIFVAVRYQFKYSTLLNGMIDLQNSP